MWRGRKCILEAGRVDRELEGRCEGRIVVLRGEECILEAKRVREDGKVCYTFFYSPLYSFVIL